MVQEQPRTLGEYVDAIRAGFVCDRCGHYVGSLARRRYVPPPYPVAIDRFGSDDEIEALVAFEWHMLDRLRRGNFVLRHPQRDGHCVSLREWVESGEGYDHSEEDGDGNAAR